MSPKTKFRVIVGLGVLFVLHAVPPERRAELRERHGQLVVKIRDSEQAPLEQKCETLSQALFYNYGLRGMPCRGVRFSNSESAVIVEVQAAEIDLNDDNQIHGRHSGRDATNRLETDRAGNRDHVRIPRARDLRT